MINEEHAELCDKWVRLPPDAVTEMWQYLIEVVDGMGIADEAQRRMVLEIYCDAFNAAIKRRDARTFH